MVVGFSPTQVDYPLTNKNDYIAPNRLVSIFADKQYRLDALEGISHMRLTPLPGYGKTSISQETESKNRRNFYGRSWQGGERRVVRLSKLTYVSITKKKKHRVLI